MRFKSLSCRRLKMIKRKKTRLPRKRVCLKKISIALAILLIQSLEIETRLLEMYKNRSIPSGEPAGD